MRDMIALGGGSDIGTARGMSMRDMISGSSDMGAERGMSMRDVMVCQGSGMGNSTGMGEWTMGEQGMEGGDLGLGGDEDMDATVKDAMADFLVSVCLFCMCECGSG